MKEFKTKAYAKINLTLDVLGKMEDGYHDMRMVMQSVSLCDDIVIEASPGSGKVSAVTNRPYIPGDDRNIACKAANAFFAETGISEYDIRIRIDKSIPVCAGLGGGSSDAAAVLRALDGGFGTGLSEEALMKLAERVGSDVPFCLMGGAALAEGRGEKLRKLPGMPDCHIVICKPSFSVSTPRLFAQIDCKKIKNRPDTDGIIAALDEGKLSDISHRVFNVFESVLPPRESGIINEIKSFMLNMEALGASMTGTGSAVFGIFNDESAANNAYNELKTEYKETYLARPV